MPKIQTYDVQQTPQPMEVVPQQTGIYTNGGKAFSEVAKQVDDITQKFREIRNVRETSKASTDLQVNLAQIEKEAQNDPNFDKPEVYQQRIDEAMATHAQTISEPAVREKAMNDFRLKSYSTYSDIQTNFRKRQIESTQYHLAKEIDASKMAYINTADPAKKKLFMDTALARLDESVKTGILSSEAATGIRRYIDTNWAKSEAMHDAESNPDLALVTFANGGYPALDTPEERKSFMEFAQNMKKRNDTQVELKQKATQINNEITLVDSIRHGNLGYVGADEVSQMIANNEISSDFGQAWLGYMSDPSVVDEISQKDPGFVSHIENILKAGSKADVNTALKEVLSRKDVKQNELAVIVKFAKDRSDQLNGVATSNGVKTGSNQSHVDAMLADIVRWSKETPGVESSVAVKEYLNKLDQQTLPAVAAQEVKVSTALKVNPRISNLPATGKIMIDRFGNKARVFPDGRIEEIKKGQ